MTKISKQTILITIFAITITAILFIWVLVISFSSSMSKHENIAAELKKGMPVYSVEYTPSQLDLPLSEKLLSYSNVHAKWPGPRLKTEEISSRILQMTDGIQSLVEIISQENLGFDHETRVYGLHILRISEPEEFENLRNKMAREKSRQNINIILNEAHLAYDHDDLDFLNNLLESVDASHHLKIQEIVNTINSLTPGEVGMRN